MIHLSIFRLQSIGNMKYIGDERYCSFTVDAAPLQPSRPAQGSSLD